MLGFHKQMDNRIKLLEEILSFRMQGVEFDNGDMYVDGHKAASDVRDEFVSVTEKLMDELAQCYNVLPQLDINNTIDHRPEGFVFSSRRRHTRSDRDWSSDVCSSDLQAQNADDRGEHERPRVMVGQLHQPAGEERGDDPREVAAGVLYSHPAASGTGAREDLRQDRKSVV